MEDDFFGAVIHGYSRAQACEDGVLINISQQFPEEARQLYKFPVAVTAAVWALIEAGVAAGVGNDYKGVVWDVLYMSQKGVTRRISPAEHLFEVIITGAGPGAFHTLRAVCGPGDEGEGVITILLPTED